jgi:hypothetical protein
VQGLNANMNVHHTGVINVGLFINAEATFAAKAKFA